MNTKNRRKDYTGIKKECQFCHKESLWEKVFQSCGFHYPLVMKKVGE